MIHDEVSRKLRERAFTLEGVALMALLCCVGMMLVAVAAAFLDCPDYSIGFIGAGTAFLFAMWFIGLRSRKLLIAAFRSEELNRRLQLRIIQQQ